MKIIEIIAITLGSSIVIGLLMIWISRKFIEYLVTPKGFMSVMKSLEKLSKRI